MIKFGIEETSIIKFRPERCPHCKVAKPHMLKKWCHQGEISISEQFYVAYQCTSCEQLVMAKIKIIYGPDSSFPQANSQKVVNYWPGLADEFSPTIPEDIRRHLNEARNGIDNPNSSVIASATSVDLMLQEKNIEETSLNAAINRAKDQGLITEDMALWAHHIRIEANGSRHRKIGTPLATKEDAEQSLEFAVALAEILFVLPARVKKGIEQSQSQTEQAPK